VTFGQQGDLPISLDRASLNLSGYLGVSPTAISLQVEGLQTTFGMLDADTRAILNQLGFTTIDTGFGTDLTWDEATGVLSVSNLHLTIADAGTVTASIQLGGITRAILADPTANEAALNDVQVLGIQLTATDDALVDRVFRWAAEGDDTPPDAFREQFVRGLPYLITLTVNPQVAAAFAAPLQSFLRDPGTLTLTIAPPQPLTLLQLQTAIDHDPFGAIALLGATLTNTPAAQ
jgi:hypothetical protein